MDSYALSKIVNEKTARAFALRSGADIYALRIGNVIEPHEYETFIPKWRADPEFRKRIAWSYIDARDLGQITDLAIAKDGLGFQIFNAANDDTSADLPTQELIDRYYPGRAGEGRTRRIRDAALQPQDQGSAGLQGSSTTGANTPRRADRVAARRRAAAHTVAVMPPST